MFGGETQGGDVVTVRLTTFISTSESTTVFWVSQSACKTAAHRSLLILSKDRSVQYRKVMMSQSYS